MQSSGGPLGRTSGEQFEAVGPNQDVTRRLVRFSNELLTMVEDHSVQPKNKFD